MLVGNLPDFGDIEDVTVSNVCASSPDCFDIPHPPFGKRFSFLLTFVSTRFFEKGASDQ